MSMKLVVAAIRGWSESPYRRQHNSQQADLDLVGLHFALVFRSLLLLFKTCLAERQWGRALCNSPHLALVAWVAWLAARRRRIYCRNRELLTSLVTLSATWSVFDLGLHGTKIGFSRHGGSALAVLALLLVHDATLPVFFYSIYLRCLVSWNAVFLPLNGLLLALQSRRICSHKLAEAEGIEAPLSLLYEVLSACHVGPTAFGVPYRTAHGPLQQCIVVNAWAVGMFGVALPLVITFELERRARRRFCRGQQQQQQQQQGQQHGGAAVQPYPLLAAEEADAMAEASPWPWRLGWRGLRPWGATWLDRYLACCCLWMLACGLGHLMPA